MADRRSGSSRYGGRRANQHPEEGIAGPSTTTTSSSFVSGPSGSTSASGSTLLAATSAGFGIGMMPGPAPASTSERRPLLVRAPMSRDSDLREPIYSCITDPHSHLPVYTNIHRIRRDIVAVVEDYLSPEQLRDMRINISVVRPLVDKLYSLNDISIVYCLLVNRAQFLHEQAQSYNRQNVNFTRAALCELIAHRILRRINEDHHGIDGLLLLAHVLVAGFEPFQNAPASVRRQIDQYGAGGPSWARLSSNNRALPALEVAILSESKLFLSSTACQKVIDAIYVGRVTYTPSSFINLIPDRYKQKPIAPYEPREASFLNHYRLGVPGTRNILEAFQFLVLLTLYLLFMFERDASRFSLYEVAFSIYSFGWVLDQFATILGHGWRVYTQNLWSFLDVIYAAVYWTYLVLRSYGWLVDSFQPGQQALDVLAMGAPVLIPRLAFTAMSDNLLFVSLRSMMADFTLLTFLAVWCFGGFLLSLAWLGEGQFSLVLISKWMVYIWFGLDGTGIHRSADFHWLLGPSLMVAFAFLGNTLFLTILVSMLSNTFSTIVANATAEIQYRKAVLTLEGVKSDAIFAYQPPFNILAILLLVPLKFLVSPRWFHKIHVACVRTINLPVLLVIAVAERRLLWPASSSSWPSASSNSLYKDNYYLAPPLAPRNNMTNPPLKRPFWDWWRITPHGDIQTVFELSPPDEVEDQIAADDDLTRHLIRKQFTRQQQADKPSAAATRPGTAGSRGTSHDGHSTVIKRLPGEATTDGTAEQDQATTATTTPQTNTDAVAAAAAAAAVAVTVATAAPSAMAATPAPVVSKTDENAIGSSSDDDDNDEQTPTATAGPSSPAVEPADHLRPVSHPRPPRRVQLPPGILRRDSIAFPGLDPGKLRSMLRPESSGDLTTTDTSTAAALSMVSAADMPNRLEALEESVLRIEAMLHHLVVTRSDGGGSRNDGSGSDGAGGGGGGGGDGEGGEGGSGDGGDNIEMAIRNHVMRERAHSAADDVIDDDELVEAEHTGSIHDLDQTADER